MLSPLDASRRWVRKAEHRRRFSRPSSPVLYVYLCAKMHFCIQHNRNRCGRFNINAVTNGGAPPFAAPVFPCVPVCVCCGHYSELRSHFPCGCGPVCVFMAPCVSALLSARQFACFLFALVISVFAGPLSIMRPVLAHH